MVWSIAQSIAILLDLDQDKIDEIYKVYEFALAYHKEEPIYSYVITFR